MAAYRMSLMGEATQTNLFSSAEIQAATPMMQQYMSIKQQHIDALLFYRMGDFYELFFEDAVVAAKALDIALTHRGKHLEQEIPMCGVPHHAYESYLHKLILSGHTVAICEQTETPAEAKKRGYKAVVKREVVRIITPGTVTEDALLQQDSANYLLSMHSGPKDIALAWADISTGELWCSSVPHAALAMELERLRPKEILAVSGAREHSLFQEALQPLSKRVREEVSSQFNSKKGMRALEDWFEVKDASSLGQFSNTEYGAFAALLSYIERTQIHAMPFLKQPKRFENSHRLHIDAATRQHLELNRSVNNEYRGSVLHAINHTVSAAGSRLLSHRLNAPLCDKTAIDARLDEIAFFQTQPELSTKLTQLLQLLPDIERCLSRLSVGRGSPQDAANIRLSLVVARQVAELFQFGAANDNLSHLPHNLQQQLQHVVQFDDLLEHLQRSLVDMPPMLLREGGVIRDGFHPKLDEYRSLSAEATAHKEALRVEYATLTGVEKLKIKDNNVIGLFIEVTQNHADALMQHPDFIHRQTMASGVRFTTERLRELESKLVHAKAYALELEIQLFSATSAEILNQSERLSLLASSLAEMDVALSGAMLATTYNYARPTLTTERDLSIHKGRHPTVERLSDAHFTPNDLQLSDTVRLWLMTGPNMAGKSTFLRQNAVIIILAQMGSFVPAEQATIGLADKIFSRVGASDNLSKGQSTFMVEMVETARILRHATAQSFVILDEIGRGTATYDGMSIAWAVLEQLHEQIGCRGLFATHYHEMTALEESLTHLQNYHMHVQEWDGEVVFLHEVKQGAADRSYGIHVAKLAGLPASVLARATQVLQSLEAEKDESSHAIPEMTELPQVASLNEATSAVLEQMGAIDPNQLSPRDALDALFELKELYNLSSTNPK